MSAIVADRGADRHPLFNLKSLQEQGTFTDVTVIVDGHRKFQAHKTILVVFSDFFRTMFDGPHWQEASSDVVYLQDDSITSDVMGRLLTYAYDPSSDLGLTQENVLETLAAADHIQAPAALKKCCDFVKSVMMEEVATLKKYFWKLTVYAEKYPDLSGFQDDLLHLFARNFCAMMELKDSVELVNAEWLGAMLERDDLCAPSEFAVLEAVLRWVRHLPGDRGQYTTSLLSNVRFGLIPKDMLTSPTLANDTCFPGLKEACHTAVQYHYLPQEFRPSMSFEYDRPRGTSNVLVAFNTDHSSFCYSDMGNTQYFDLDSRQWITLKQVKPPSIHPVGSSAILDGRFMVVRCEKEIFSLDLGNESWEKLPDMIRPNPDSQLCLHDGFLYAISATTSERYDKSTGHWQWIAPLNEPRTGIALVSYMGHLYAIGGTKDMESSNTVEAFDPKRNKWDIKSSTTKAHSKTIAFVANGKMCVTSGDYGTCNASVVEVYSYGNSFGAWSKVDQSLVSPGAVQAGSKVFFIVGRRVFDGGVRILPDQVFPTDMYGWREIWEKQDVWHEVVPLAVERFE
ncbi:kelch-like protein diablo [Branchiostoma lanceolatum]|uniref:kelch-like protein diablo n=1 Tax=Branchiostoma lanceolatum TaxID=7740 RepID=UPI0034564716